MAMGILDRAGFNVGPHGSVKSIENPGGFYEVPTLQAWCYNKDAFHHNRPFQPQLSIDDLRKLSKQKPALLKIIENDFSGKFPIAMKAMDFAGLSCFESDPDYDVRVIFLRRKIKDQATSIRRMHGDRGASHQEWCDWLIKMYEWAYGYFSWFDFQYTIVDFEKIITDTEASTKKILDACGVDYENIESIKKWVNPSFSRSMT